MPSLPVSFLIYAIYPFAIQVSSPLSQFKESTRAPAHLSRKRFTVYSVIPCKRLLVTSLSCKVCLGEGGTLSIAVARLTCGQQRERLMQVSNAQGHTGFSP